MLPVFFSIKSFKIGIIDPPPNFSTIRASGAGGL
jgi:hypothetical protein